MIGIRVERGQEVMQTLSAKLQDLKIQRGAIVPIIGAVDCVVSAVILVIVTIVLSLPQRLTSEPTAIIPVATFILAGFLLIGKLIPRKFGIIAAEQSPSSGAESYFGKSEK